MRLVNRTQARHATYPMPKTSNDPVWKQLQEEAREATRRERVLTSLLHECVLNCPSLELALAHRLARKVGRPAVSELLVLDVFSDILCGDPRLGQAVRADLMAIRERDPAACGYLAPFLYFKGFHALSTHRVAHRLWRDGRRDLALYLQSVMSEVFSVDIHPAARLGCGILLDHATGLVVGETAVIEDGCSILQGVTLGGTGKEAGDRHPKVRAGVLIGAGSKILGNIEIGEGAWIGANSVVLSPVPPHTTVVGVPARVVGKARVNHPADSMDQRACLEAEGAGGFHYEI